MSSDEKNIDSSSHSKPYVTDLREADVIMGRGHPNMMHEGNCYLRELVQSRREEYTTARRCKEKADIAASVLQSIHERGGRFLKGLITEQDRKKLGVPDGVQAWVCLDDTLALEKVKQNFRDATAAAPRAASPANVTTATVHPPNVENPFLRGTFKMNQLLALSQQGGTISLQQSEADQLRTQQEQQQLLLLHQQKQLLSRLMEQQQQSDALRRIQEQQVMRSLLENRQTAALLGNNEQPAPPQLDGISPLVLQQLQQLQQERQRQELNCALDAQINLSHILKANALLKQQPQATHPGLNVNNLNSQPFVQQQLLHRQMDLEALQKQITRHTTMTALSSHPGRVEAASLSQSSQDRGETPRSGAREDAPKKKRKYH